MKKILFPILLLVFCLIMPFASAVSVDEQAAEALYQLGDSFDLRGDFYTLLRKFFTVIGKRPERPRLNSAPEHHIAA